MTQLCSNLRCQILKGESVCPDDTSSAGPSPAACQPTGPAAARGRAPSTPPPATGSSRQAPATRPAATGASPPSTQAISPGIRWHPTTGSFPRWCSRLPAASPDTGGVQPYPPPPALRTAAPSCVRRADRLRGVRDKRLRALRPTTGYRDTPLVLTAQADSEFDLSGTPTMALHRRMMETQSCCRSRAPLAVLLLCQGLGTSPIQGYLAHKKQPPTRTLQQDYTQGPMVFLGEGLFLMSEVPLERGWTTYQQKGGGAGLHASR